MLENHSLTTQTTGRFYAGDSTTGKLETVGDRNWFAVNLASGKTDRFDFEGRALLYSTLYGPYLRGIDAAEIPPESSIPPHLELLAANFRTVMLATARLIDGPASTAAALSSHASSTTDER